MSEKNVLKVYSNLQVIIGLTQFFFKIKKKNIFIQYFKSDNAGCLKYM